MSKEISKYISLLIVVVSILGLTLPLHYIQFEGHWKVWAKESWTFKNTYLDKDIIQKMVDQYNNEYEYGKIGLNNSPIFRTLKEHKVIYLNEQGKLENGFK